MHSVFMTFDMVKTSCDVYMPTPRKGLDSVYVFLALIPVLIRSCASGLKTHNCQYQRVGYMSCLMSRSVVFVFRITGFKAGGRP